MTDRAAESGTGHDTAPAEKIGDRVICPDGERGYVAFVHPHVPGAVFVQLDGMRPYMREDLKRDA
jgi:hypothetical protein